MKISYGVVHLNFSITCPYCDFYHSIQYEKDWFDENFPELSYENADKYNTKVQCNSCDKEFEIEQFEY